MRSALSLMKSCRMVSTEEAALLKHCDVMSEQLALSDPINQSHDQVKFQLASSATARPRRSIPAEAFHPLAPKPSIANSQVLGHCPFSASLCVQRICSMLMFQIPSQRSTAMPIWFLSLMSRRLRCFDPADAVQPVQHPAVRCRLMAMMFAVGQSM